MFPEGQREGLYHTADATLWFFHALDRYVTVTRRSLTLVEQLLPVLQEIVRCHRAGHALQHPRRPADGLLAQGAPGCQLTWMDALGRRLGGDAAPRQGGRDQRALAQRAACCCERGSTRRARTPRADDLRARGGALPRAVQRPLLEPETRRLLYDVVDAEGGGDDDACRPNQLLAIALPHPPLDRRTGRRCSTSCARAADAGRPAHRWRRRTPTTSASTSAICAPATRPTTRARSGRG